MSESPGGYAFADGIPVDPLDAGTTVLVAGPALSRAEDLAQSMVADGSATGEGMLFISTNKTCESLLESCERTHPSFRKDLAGVIDCSGQDLGGVRPEAQVKTVSTQSDLTGIGMKFSSLYEALYADAREGRVRTGLVSLTSLSMYVDIRKLFRFAQTLSGRIDSADGLGVFAIDPTTHDRKAINTLSQTVDGRIDVEEPNPDSDADGTLRVRGFPEQSTDWKPFSLP